MVFVKERSKTMENVRNKSKEIKILLALAAALIAMLLIFSYGEIQAQAKTYKISTPEQLVDINWKFKGYGPGNKYIITNDFTLGDGEDATCRLTKGKFVIDFNGHTVQNSSANLCVFSLSGADVVFMDSKVSNNKASVRSYGMGAIDMTAGKLEIRSGNYVGLSNGQNNPVGLHVGGGSCVVNGGFIGGDYIGSDCAGGTLKINGGKFEGGYLFALEDFGGNGNIRISKGTFIGGSANNKYQFPLGAFFISNYYDFDKWLVGGSSYSSDYYTYYWNMQSQFSYSPTNMCNTAVMYGPSVMSVKSSVKAPKTKIKKLVSKKSKTLKVCWAKKTKITGYQIQLSTNKKFKKNVKTVNIKGAKNKAKTVKKLKSRKKYYVRVRTYRKFNGTTLYSKWSKIKVKKVKKKN